MRFITCLFLFFFSLSYSFAQGTLSGRVTDIKGELLIGVKLVALEDKSIITKTDLEGQYTLKFPDAKPYTIKVIFIGYDTISAPFEFKKSEVINKDFTLNEYTTTKNIQELSIIGKQIRANDYYMEKVKVNSATTIDYISSETMKRTGDQNATAALARVSGVSTNGGLITVRGIGDRYVKTTLNGARIPTLDPLTNNIKLDIFPTSLIDNIVITKSASPDLPGDWAGAYISVETKDYPDKLTVNLESQFGVNAQSTFQDFITSDRSATDWLGFDRGLRSREENNFIEPQLNPTSYQEMVALGLGNYFSSIGVNGWIDGTSESNTYMKLGLVQLGLLSPSSMNDNASYQQALQSYNSTFKLNAFQKINPDGTDYNNGFKNNWTASYRRAPINYTQNFSIGDQTTLFGKKLGYLFGFRYGSSVRYDPNGISQRLLNEEAGFQVEFQDSARISKETNSWSILMNLAYKLNDNNKFTFLYMPNFYGANDVSRFSNMPDVNLGQSQEFSIRNLIFYEQRSQQIMQFSSQHFIPKIKLKIDLNSTYTIGKSLAPDFKLIQYQYNKTGESTINYEFATTAGEGIRRFYRSLNENIFDSRINMEMPIDADSKLARKLKFGGAFQGSDRVSLLDEYFLAKGNTFVPNLQSEDVNAYLSPDKMIMNNGQIDFYYKNAQFARNNSFGTGQIASLFFMTDYEFSNKLRLSAGIRAESTDLFTDVIDYDKLGYSENDKRRENLGGFPLINAANIKQVNYLPSASLIYKIKNDSTGQTNLRFNVSQTMARPSFRELYDGAVYDYEFRTLIYGNSQLKPVAITNFDFRGESYFKNGDNVSVSLFYKDFKNHIEMGFQVDGITWENIEVSNVKGIELEFKKKIGKSFDLRSNITLVQSTSQFVVRTLEIVDGIKEFTPVDTINRPMFGQAPYIINTIASYKNDKIGVIATLSYNIQGPRLVISSSIKGLADVYEIQRNLIDFKVSKNLGEHFVTNITIRDLLNAPVNRSYKLPDGSYQIYDKFRYGTNFNLGIAYKL
jgi:outer membrane receptor for ferrienterochelin and colicin